MAQKKISDLQLISEVTAGVMMPGDDGLQTYRLTAAQLKAYILANGNITLAMLNDAIFNGLTGVTLADDDYLPIVDTSDSNKTKKVLANSFKNAVYRSVTTTDSVGVSDETMKLSGASFTSTLPTAVGVAGKKYKFLHAGTSLTQIYTLATTSSQTIGGVASGDFKLITNGEVLEIESDGANWIILNHYAVTDWIDAGAMTITATTTNPTKGVMGTDKVFWRRIGDIGHFRYVYYQTASTGANSGSGDYLFALPSNMTFHSSQTYFTTVSNAQVAAAASAARLKCSGLININSGSGDGDVHVYAYDSSKFRLGNEERYASSGNWGSGYYGIAGSAIIGMTVHFEAKMSEWQP